MLTIKMNGCETIARFWELRFSFIFAKKKKKMSWRIEWWYTSIVSRRSSEVIYLPIDEILSIYIWPFQIECAYKRKAVEMRKSIYVHKVFRQWGITHTLFNCNLTERAQLKTSHTNYIRVINREVRIQRATRKFQWW